MEVKQKFFIWIHYPENGFWLAMRLWGIAKDENETSEGILFELIHCLKRAHALRTMWFTFYKMGQRDQKLIGMVMKHPKLEKIREGYNHVLIFPLNWQSISSLSSFTSACNVLVAKECQRSLGYGTTLSLGPRRLAELGLAGLGW